MKINRGNFTPPGYDPEQSEKAFYIVLMVISVLMSFSFFYRLDDALFHLYIIEGSKRILIEGAVMTDFIGLLEWSFYGFPVTACIAPFFIGYRYAYFFKESKSIYLIKRLPAKGEIFPQMCSCPSGRGGNRTGYGAHFVSAVFCNIYACNTRRLSGPGSMV